MKNALIIILVLGVILLANAGLSAALSEDDRRMYLESIELIKDDKEELTTLIGLMREEGVDLSDEPEIAGKLEDAAAKNGIILEDFPVIALGGKAVKPLSKDNFQKLGGALKYIIPIGALFVAALLVVNKVKMRKGVNDYNIRENKVRNYIKMTRRKGFGDKRIINHLKSKGISNKEIRSALGDLKG